MISDKKSQILLFIKNSKMYLVCKLFGTWTLYNGNSKTSKTLSPQQIELVKDLFSDDLTENAILDTLKVIPISASKLKQETAAMTIVPPGKKAA